MPGSPRLLAAAAAARGETLAEVAHALGLQPQTIYRVSGGHLRPWPKLRRALAEHFDVDEADLFPEQVAS